MKINSLSNIDAEESRELVSSLKIALPMIITSMLGMVLATIDTYIAGTMSIEALTAVSVGNSLFWLVAVPLITIINSMDVFLSRAFGASDRKSLDDWLVQGFWISSGLIVIGMPLILFISLFYQFTHISDEAYQSVIEYLKGLLPSLILILLCVPLEKYWNCQNRVRLWTTMSVILIPINYFLDLYISTHSFNGLNLGVFGIGATTTLCNLMNLIVITVYSKIMWKKLGGFTSKSFRPDLGSIKRVLKLGLPASGQAATDVLGFSLLNFMAAFFGNKAVAAHQVVFIISTLFYMIATGWSNAASIRIGYYIGAQRFSFAARLGTLNLAVISLVFAVFSILVWIEADFLIGLFLTDSDIINLSKSILGLCVLMITANAVQCLKGNTLRAWGDTSKAFYTNLVAFYIVGLPLAFYLSFYTNTGILGLWIGLFAIMLVCAGSNVTAWFYVIRKYPRTCLTL